MMYIYIILAVSLLANALLGWYVVGLLRKFLFVSQNMSDLYLILKSFDVFAKSLYSMNSYHGEPLIQELIYKLKAPTEEKQE